MLLLKLVRQIFVTTQANFSVYWRFEKNWFINFISISFLFAFSLVDTKHPAPVCNHTTKKNLKDFFFSLKITKVTLRWRSSWRAKPGDQTVDSAVLQIPSSLLRNTIQLMWMTNKQVKPTRCQLCKLFQPSRRISGAGAPIDKFR